MAEPALTQAELYGIAGPFLVGTAVTTLLSGITLTQCFTYFSNFSSDRPIYKWAVWFLIVLDVIHTVICWVTLWLWNVRHFGSLEAVSASPWSFAVEPVLSGITATIVQFFYAYRIYVLNKKKILIPAIVAFISLFQLGWSVGATYTIFHLKYFLDFHVWQYGVSAWLGSAALCDAIITVTLCMLLIKAKNGGMQKTNTIIDKLVRATVETNGLTFCAAIIDAALFAARPDAAHVAPNLCLMKLYFNSFLVSLNSRTELQQHLDSTQARELPLAPMGKSSKDTVTIGSQPSRIRSVRMNSTFESIGSLSQNPGVHVVTTATITSEKMVGDADSWEEEMNDARGEKRGRGHMANVVGGRNNVQQLDDVEATHPYSIKS